MVVSGEFLALRDRLKGRPIAPNMTLGKFPEKEGVYFKKQEPGKRPVHASVDYIYYIARFPVIGVTPV